MAEITVMRTPAETRLGEQFKAQAGAGSPAREAAFATFVDKGLPHRRIEAWHYTDLRSLWRDAFPPAGAPGETRVSAARAALGGAAGPRLVLLNGMFASDLSTLGGLPAGLSITPLLDGLGSSPTTSAPLQAAEALGKAESVLALNTAFLQGGALLTVAAGTRLEQPIEIVSVTTGETPAAVSTRMLVDVGPNASATVVERHVALGQADRQGNHTVVFAVGDGATLAHTCELEGLSAGSIHLGTTLTRLGAEARFVSFTLVATLGVVRRQSFLEFAGANATGRFNGVTLLEGRAHADTTLVITHTGTGCESREYYKTILDDESTGVYQGKVIVAPGAQKTDGKMLSKAVFLADGASMYNKPELEIFADDVVCGHGATVGSLDEDQLFYLRARGIPLREAQSLLLNAFAADAVDDVPDEASRDALTGKIQTWLARRHL